LVNIEGVVVGLTQLGSVPLTSAKPGQASKQDRPPCTPYAPEGRKEGEKAGRQEGRRRREGRKEGVLKGRDNRRKEGMME
jgi:hypothetical protein